MQPGLDRYLGQRPGSYASSHDHSSSRDASGSFHQTQLPNNNLQFMTQQLDPMDHQQRYLSYSMNSNRFREPSPQSSSLSMKSDSFVFNVEGLSSPSWNCERLFNLLCLYGNVSRVSYPICAYVC
jgi:hypothetical protein